ncbi:hypothetical protein BCR33DRAFT_502183 [Rhizoclosmatium globosum]|uniref:Zn(2)-C6 fungal-type domain-containing protein n=1 Tax=Rhizoclosmatium globosum TaxID=329046 RepID=A0A1Y2CVR9_9FUNG|nr:hypothetical protein BCR33DRAFT_502183 [Rhizoclosmatium globosum]|eukprot:ORY51067.1 hypothetical protein BCR33DRAFT_502183 [Rhizoclosmatium globosum]
MPKSVRVCLSCQKVRRKCVPTQTESCERCLRMNKPCEYNDPAPVVLRWKACVRCHNSHVKCNPGADGGPCERCLRLDASCSMLMETWWMHLLILIVTQATSRRCRVLDSRCNYT